MDAIDSTNEEYFSTLHERPGQNLYSFDIFDTCISRYFHKPTDIFLELAIHVQSNKKPEYNENNLRNLYQNRIQAELIARQKSKKEDITLLDIYNELSKVSCLDIDFSQMLQLEIELELNNVFAIPNTLKLYKKLRANNRVIFISDMYLPSNLLSKMLNNCGFSVSEKDIYVSSEIGLTKRSGRLFKHVLSQESVRANRVIHYGDNSHSDFHVARRLGIQAFLIEDVHTYSRYEKQITNIHTLPCKVINWINQQTKVTRPYLYCKKHKYTVATELAISKMASLMKATRLSASDHFTDNNHMALISSGVATPLLITFVSWVLTQAKQKGINRLFFISRNGQIFHKIACQLCQRQNYEIDCRYIYGSRSAWYPASMYELDDYFFRILREKYSDSTVLQILKELKFDDTEIFIITKNEGYSIEEIAAVTDFNQVEYFFRKIQQSETKKQFIKKFSFNRKLVQQYLSDAGLTKSQKAGIVDVGWHLSSHLALYRILNANEAVGFTGFYLGVDKTHEKVPPTAPYLSFFDNTQTKKNNWLFKLGAMTLLEDVFAAGDHGSVCGYKKENHKISPILSTTNFNYSPTVAKIQNDVVIAANFASRLFNIQELANLNFQVMALYKLFYKAPKIDEVKNIAESNIFARVDQNIDQRRILARPLKKLELANIIWRTLFHKKNISPDWMWFEGSAAMSEWSIRLLGRILSRCNQLIEQVEK